MFGLGKMTRLNIRHVGLLTRRQVLREARGQVLLPLMDNVINAIVALAHANAGADILRRHARPADGDRPGGRRRRAHRC